MRRDQLRASQRCRQHKRASGGTLFLYIQVSISLNKELFLKKNRVPPVAVLRLAGNREVDPSAVKKFLVNVAMPTLKKKKNEKRKLGEHGCIQPGYGPVRT